MVGAALQVDAQIGEEDAARRVAGFSGHPLDVSFFDLVLGRVDHVLHGLRVVKSFHKLVLEVGDIKVLSADLRKLSSRLNSFQRRIPQNRDKRNKKLRPYDVHLFISEGDIDDS